MGFIGGKVWRRIDADGSPEDTQDGIYTVVSLLKLSGQGCAHDLFENTDQPYLSIPTTESGEFSFPNLDLGEYCIVIDIPNGYELSHTSRNPQMVELGMGEHVTSIEYTLSLQPGSIGGVVYLDDNRNGSLDTGEATVPGVILGLRQWKDQVEGLEAIGDLALVLSKADGRYDFGGLASDCYRVSVVDVLESRIDSRYSLPSNGESQQVCVDRGNLSRVVNFGWYRSSSELPQAIPPRVERGCRITYPLAGDILKFSHPGVPVPIRGRINIPNLDGWYLKYLGAYENLNDEWGAHHTLLEGTQAPESDFLGWWTPPTQPPGEQREYNLWLRCQYGSNIPENGEHRVELIIELSK